MVLEVSGDTATGYYIDHPDAPVEWNAEMIEWIILTSFT